MKTGPSRRPVDGLLSAYPRGLLTSIHRWSRRLRGGVSAEKPPWAGTMTVFEVAVVANPGGTSSESSIARDRPHRGDVRRRDIGRRRRVDRAGDADGPSRTRSADR